MRIARNIVLVSLALLLLLVCITLIQITRLPSVLPTSKMRKVTQSVTVISSLRMLPLPSLHQVHPTVMKLLRRPHLMDGDLTILN